MTSRRPSAAERRILPEGRFSGPMPWVIAIMMFLTALAAASGLALAGAARALGSDLEARATIQIVEANPDRREAQARNVAAELARLSNVRSVERVDDAAMSALLEPWLGDAAVDAELPVPAMIDVQLARTGERDFRQLAETVAAAAPAARVDRHAQWLGPLASLIGALKWLAAGLVLLMAAATAAAVVLAARAALNTHRATIDVLHLMGATDGQVATMFQRRIALDALFGGVIGVAVGALVILLLGGRLGALGSDLLQSGGLGVSDWVAIALLPLAAAALAMLAARLTILGTLRRML